MPFLVYAYFLLGSFLLGIFVIFSKIARQARLFRQAQVFGAKEHRGMIPTSWHFPHKATDGSPFI